MLEWLDKNIAFCTTQSASRGNIKRWYAAFIASWKRLRSLVWKKYALYKHFHTIKSCWICECLLWNASTVICTCFEVLGKHRQTWQVCVRAITCVITHAQIKEDCFYLYKAVFRHCKEESWYNEVKNNRPPTLPSTLHILTRLFVQLTRQMWIFWMQLCSENTFNMFNKERKSNPANHTWHIRPDEYEAHLL